MKRQIKGFTVVEMLIVIVVIGILAGITILAYSGMRMRAEVAALNATAASWIELIEIEELKSNVFSGPPGSYCLGNDISNFPTSPKFYASVCATEGPFAAGYSVSYFSTWKTKADLPSGLVPYSKVSAVGIDNLEARGIILWLNSKGDPPFITWYPQISGECGRGKKTDSNPKGSTKGGECSYEFKG